MTLKLKLRARTGRRERPSALGAGAPARVSARSGGAPALAGALAGHLGALRPPPPMIRPESRVWPWSRGNVLAWSFRAACVFSVVACVATRHWAAVGWTVIALMQHERAENYRREVE